MQSYLQYRRLGDSVRAQLDRAHAQRNTNLVVKGDLAQSSSLGSESISSTESADRINCEDAAAVASSSQPLEKSKTKRSEKTALAHSLAGIDIKKQLASTNQPADLFIVGWDGHDDPQNPKNYSFSSRLVATLLVSALAWVVGAASSINSGVLPQNTAAFGVSDVVGSLVTGIEITHSIPLIDIVNKNRIEADDPSTTLGLYLLGFAAGSLVSGPLSEILGRNVVYTGSLTLFMIFIMGSALAPNIGAQLAFRFLAGIFGCPPLTCAGGTIADLWNPLEKTIYFPMYAILSFGGPVLGPVIASYIGQTGVLSWRWTAWIILIMSGAILVLIILFQPETYSPLLLKWKGKQLRRIAGDSRFRSEMDMEKIALFSRIGGALKRQFLITIHEPIILLISLYMTVLYIVLFTFFDGYTYIFTDVHGLSQGLTNIVWVAMYVGISLATFLVFPIYRWTKKDFTQAAQAVNGADPAVDLHALDDVHTKPEIRLWFAMFGAPAIPISLFWMGWTDFVSGPQPPTFESSCLIGL